MYRAGQAYAALHGRDYVIPDDIKAVAEPALAHRLIMRTAATIRDVEQGTVHATGSPVRLEDASGSVVSSSSLTWNQADGSVTVAGGTETIYYPQEES